MSKKLLDTHDVLKEELKDKEFRKHYKQEGHRLFSDRLKEDLSNPRIRAAFKKIELPVFKTEADEVRFWDTHSPLDYPGEFVDVKDPFKFAPAFLKKIAKSREERKRSPTHPGGILKRQYLEPLSLTVSLVARSLGVSRKTLSKIVNERGSITPDMAARLSKAFNTTPELWLNLQQNHDLWHTLHNTSAWKRVPVLVA
jgi:addiction module HigA family antidote